MDNEKNPSWKIMFGSNLCYIKHKLGTNVQQWNITLIFSKQLYKLYFSTPNKL